MGKGMSKSILAVVLSIGVCALGVKYLKMPTLRLRLSCNSPSRSSKRFLDSP